MMLNTYKSSLLLAKNNSLSGGTLSAVEVTAVDFLCRGLDINTIAPTSGAIYPLVGITAISQSLNLLNPETNRITWVAGNAANHTALGWQASNSFGSYANTTIAVNSFGRNLTAFVYSRTNSAVTGLDITSNNTSAGSRLRCILKGLDNNLVFDAFASTEQLIVSAISNSQRLFTFTKSAATSRVVQDGTTRASSTTVATSAPIPTTNIYFGRDPSNTSIQAGNRQYAILGIIPALASSDEVAFNSIVVGTETIRGRNV